MNWPCLFLVSFCIHDVKEASVIMASDAMEGHFTHTLPRAMIMKL